MPFIFADKNRKYLIKKIKGDEKIILRLKRMGIVEGKQINNIGKNNSGLIAIINNETRIAIDKNLASKIIVEEYIC